MKLLTITLLCIFALPLNSFAESQPSEADVNKCFAEISNIQDIHPIIPKMAITNVFKPTFEQLANQDKPTAYEKTLISKFAQARKVCADMHLQCLGEDFYAPFRKAHKKDHENVNLVLIRLYNQEISYGEYLRIRQQLHSSHDEEMQSAEKERQRDENQTNQENQRAEALQRARNAQFWANAFGGMADGIRNSMPPRAVTCVPTGFGVRCQ